MKNFMAFDLPHACGDEPPNLADLLDTEKICPTHVGMNRAAAQLCAYTPRICPTHVGMNRCVDNVLRVVPNLPHACGDEPEVTEDDFGASDNLPHACGDEPPSRPFAYIARASAPRMWG